MRFPLMNEDHQEPHVNHPLDEGAKNVHAIAGRNFFAQLTTQARIETSTMKSVERESGQSGDH